jgi:glucosamine--fructose-6-phosphate aminotransferase (isomerizing)
MTTVFEQEIRSQAQLLSERAEPGAIEAARVAAALRDVDYVLAAARGSSDNAAVFFQYLAGQELGLVVALAAPSLYEGERTMGLAGAGVLAISQSGRTPGLVNVIEQAVAQDRPHAVITNYLDSPLAAVSANVIELRAGAERAIASTKTFSTTWHALAQLVGALKGSPLEGLDTFPDVVGRTAEWALGSELPTALLDVDGGLTVVGRGVGQAVAAEIALKIREVTGIRAEAYSAADFLHGPIGAGGDGSTLLLCVTDEMTDAVGSELVSECRRFGMRTVVLRDGRRADLSGDADILLGEAMPNWCLGLAEVIVGQALSLRLGERRGRPIDTAPGLKKVTLSA